MASVKVAVRVRPFNEREISMDSKCIIKMSLNKTTITNLKASEITASFSDQSLSRIPARSTNELNSLLTNSQTNLSLSNSQHSPNSLRNSSSVKEFMYDASYWSFDPADPHFISQSDVYNDLGKLTVNNAFEGYNACVCAYGQTGSGKSYSMMGQTDSEAEEGLIPRICKALFEKVEKKRNKNEAGSPSASNQTAYRAEVSYLEIYNEKVRDLLRSSEKCQEKLKVREHPKTGVYVQGLSQHIVESYSDIEELLNRGNANRTTASTNMNDTSSRSHAIFTLKFSQVKFVENNIPSETTSKMNLVDLAGSERADSTGATGIRLKEGGNINKSLLTFINVISTLADLSGNPNSAKHYIPYRDSCLTWLLKDSLGGNSKTVILAAISPADVNYVETMSTLRYANRAKNIINKPTVNEDPNVKLIRDLRSEIVFLKSLLEGNPAVGLSFQSSSCSANDNEDKIMNEIETKQSRIDEITSQIMSAWQQRYDNYFEENKNLCLEKSRNKCISLSVKSQPYLLSIDEASPDILNSVSIYPLRHGKTSFGSNENNGSRDVSLTGSAASDDNGEDDDNDKNNVLLFGSNVKIRHCYLTRLDSKCYICPLDGYVQLNDRILSRSDSHSDEEDIDLGAELKHGDLLLLGDKNLFIYNNPCDLEEESYFGPCLKQRLTFSYLMKHIIGQERQSSLATICEEKRGNEVSEKAITHLCEVDNLRLQVKASDAQINELKIKIQELNNQLEANKQEMKSLAKRVASEQEETSTIISSLNLERSEMGAYVAYASVEASELHQEQEDSISQDFDQQDQIHSAIEKFEDEKLLNECLKSLGNKAKEDQLKSLIFELQSLKLKEEKLEADLKQSHQEIEQSVEKLNEKRDRKLEDFNRLREMLHKDQNMVDLKSQMSGLNCAEMDVENQIKEVEVLMEEDLDTLNSLNTELRIKKMYSTSGNSLEDLIEAEQVTILNAKHRLELAKKAKEESYAMIEVEFEKARGLLVAEAEQNDGEFVKLNLEVAQSSHKELELKDFLKNCLFENDEEKCLIENELAEMIEVRERVEQGRLRELRAKHEHEVNERLKVEYKGLEELKEQDLAELKQDEDRIQLLVESSIRRVKENIKEREESVARRNGELKSLKQMAEVNRLKMNMFLVRLEEFEGKRITEENRIFNEETKLAGEFKTQTSKFNAQASKLETAYRKKMSQLMKAKNSLQPKLCSLVGPYKGIQLFEANFNPNTTKDFNLDNSRRTMSSLFIDTMNSLTSSPANRDV